MRPRHIFKKSFAISHEMASKSKVSELTVKVAVESNPSTGIIADAV